MPRDLADVLHYFLPELEEGSPSSDTAEMSSAPAAPRSRLDRVAPIEPRETLPILGLTIGDHDVVRAALAWNLAIETTRLGGSTLLLAPEIDRGSPLWPEAGVGPLGSELLFCPAKDLRSLYQAAAELASCRAESAKRGGIVFVRIPPAWLDTDDEVPDILRWVLHLSGASQRDLDQSLALAAQLVSRHPKIEIGVTLHGVSSISEARSAYETLARRAQSDLGLFLISYGLLVDDLHVYRAIAAQRPIGLEHPQAPATRALMDVARLLYKDARSRTLG